MAACSQPTLCAFHPPALPLRAFVGAAASAARACSLCLPVVACSELRSAAAHGAARLGQRMDAGGGWRKFCWQSGIASSATVKRRKRLF